jgi:hypothetical protein
MGTITRSFANNITTSGVLLPASLTNNSIANVTAYNAAVSTGNMVLLSTQTASNSASISFTTGINSTYKEYQFYFIDIDIATDSTSFTFQGSTDGGSNYGVTTTDTYFQAYVDETGTSGATIAYAGTRDLAQSTGEILLTDGISNASDSSFVGTLSLFNPASTTFVKHFISTNTTMWDAFGVMNTFVAGYMNTASAINAVRFKATTGNFSGTILMYGIV